MSCRPLGRLHLLLLRCRGDRGGGWGGRRGESSSALLLVRFGGGW